MTNVDLRPGFPCAPMHQLERQGSRSGSCGCGGEQRFCCSLNTFSWSGRHCIRGVHTNQKQLLLNVALKTIRMCCWYCHNRYCRELTVCEGGAMAQGFESMRRWSICDAICRGTCLWWATRIRQSMDGAVPTPTTCRPSSTMTSQVWPAIG